jgi:dCMP deaminase
MKEKYLKSYMAVAEIFAEQSSAKRLHVGAIVVKDDRIISIGYNGMPSGWDNECEDTFIIQDEVAPGVFSLTKRTEFKTKPEVLHAETNAIAKLAKSTESGEGASIFITHAPCLECAKLIYQSGIKEVFYKNEYRSEDGINFLKKCNIDIVKL